MEALYVRQNKQHHKNKDKDLPPRENVDNLFPDEVNAEDKANI